MSARFLREESGVVLGLAIVLVVLIAVMGAGLLTIVVSDLQATLEANQGQRAFEMAEAGIEVAKARLAEDPGLSVWSSAELRMERMEGGTAVVTVERSGEDGTRYVATSTGEYAGARRRIEATPLRRRRRAGAPRLAGTLRVTRSTGEVLDVTIFRKRLESGPGRPVPPLTPPCATA